MRSKTVYKSPEGKTKILSTYNAILNSWNIPKIEKIIRTSYGNTFVIECGDKVNPTLILLHGSAYNSSMWIEPIKELAKQYHVFAIDTLGEPGKSDEVRLSYKSNDHSLWLKELFDVLDIEKAFVIGYSQGGWIAAKFAATYPNHLKKLVLVAPSGIITPRASFLIRVIFYSFMGKWGVEKIKRISFGNIEIPKAIDKYITDIMQNFNARTDPMPFLSDEELKRLSMPVNIFIGKDDTIYDAEKMQLRIREALPNAEFHVLTDGHLILDGSRILYQLSK